MPKLVDRRLIEVADIQREIARTQDVTHMLTLQERVESLLADVKQDMDALAKKARPWTYVQPAY